MLPPMLVLHGTADKSVPVEIAQEFVAALDVSGSKACVRCECVVCVRCVKTARQACPPLAPRPPTSYTPSPRSSLRPPMFRQGAGARARLKLYVGKTHTQPIVEDPMRGGRDELMDDLLAMVRVGGWVGVGRGRGDGGEAGRALQVSGTRLATPKLAPPARPWPPIPTYHPPTPTCHPPALCTSADHGAAVPQPSVPHAAKRPHRPGHPALPLLSACPGCRSPAPRSHPNHPRAPPLPRPPLPPSLHVFPPPPPLSAPTLAPLPPTAALPTHARTVCVPPPPALPPTLAPCPCLSSCPVLSLKRTHSLIRSLAQPASSLCLYHSHPQSRETSAPLPHQATLAALATARHATLRRTHAPSRRPRSAAGRGLASAAQRFAVQPPPNALLQRA